MILKRFRVRLFRSVIDSGDVEVSKTTPLVGVNETGKTNVLMALEAINSAEDIRYEAHANLTVGHGLSELNSSFGDWFIYSEWGFSPDELERLKKIQPRFGPDTYAVMVRSFDSEKSDSWIIDLSDWVVRTK
jgi:hypothetical protein